MPSFRSTKCDVSPAIAVTVRIEVGTEAQPQRSRKIGVPCSVSSAVAPKVQAKPGELWHDPSADARRVKEGFPSKMGKPASLYLIKPDEIESIRVWSEHNTYPGAAFPVKKKRVLRIQYRAVSHECDIDDPVFSEKYFPKFPSVNDGVMNIKLTKPSETFICVSLTGSYYGHHYKIAAAFFEPLFFEPLK